MKYKILIASIFMILFQGCAPDFHILDSKSDWIARKESSFKQIDNLWENQFSSAREEIPYIIYDYLGYSTNSGMPYITFENIRFDYFHGYIYLRRNPDSLKAFDKYFPFGIYAFEYNGAIGSYKELYSRPTLPNFVISLGLNGALFISPVSFIIPTRGWEEECFHVSQEVLHPAFYENSMDFMEVITLKDIPIVHQILQALLYYAHPLEIDAKIKKWLYFGFVFNLDCDTAWKRFNTLRIFAAERRCYIENIPFTSKEKKEALNYLNLSYKEIEETNNPILNKVKEISGIIQRKPYSQKFVYAPWVKGVMREKEELPYVSRTFVSLYNFLMEE